MCNFPEPPAYVTLAMNNAKMAPTERKSMYETMAITAFTRISIQDALLL